MYLQKLIEDINKTHEKLGELIAVCLLIVEAHKFGMIVSPSGCGKSRAIKFIGREIPDACNTDSFSTASLVDRVDTFTNFRSVIAVEDIAHTTSADKRTSTINTLSKLVYTHRLQEQMYKFDFSIEDFYGSALVGIQPRLLRDIMIEPIWDAQIQDKVLRYYHLYRPKKPNNEYPKVKLRFGIGIENVDDFDTDIHYEKWQKLQTIANSQWSRARIREHLTDLLKAVASLDYRNEVIENDYDLLIQLLKPMSVESIAVTREDLESEKMLDNTLLLLLTEYYSYNGVFSLLDLSSDYKGVTIQQARRIMDRNNGYWYQIGKSPTIFTASDELKDLLTSVEMDILDYQLGLEMFK